MIGERVTRSDNPDGSPNFQTDKGFLHSRRNPAEEADRFARVVLNRVRENPEAQFLVVGIGWGYVVEAFHSLDPGGVLPIFFLEPLDDVSRQLNDSGRRVVLETLLPGKLLDGLDALLPGDRALLQVSPAYERFFGEEIRALLTMTESFVDRGTRQVFFGRWLRHHLRFLVSPGKARFVPPLPRKYGPVVFCGAAPSLCRDLEARLADLRSGRAFVMAADTAFAPLLASGIRPDLVISVDAGRGTEFHFAAAAAIDDIRGIPVLTWSGTSPVLHLYSRELLYFRTSFPMDQLLGSGPLAKVPEWINTSRNTAGIALLAARAMGRTRLFYAGVSFRTENGETHARGTGYTLFALFRQSRTRTLEMYRPRGYAVDLTEKNRIASAGLAEMASNLSLAFSPIGESALWDEEWREARTQESAAMAGGGNSAATNMEFGRGELRDFFRRVREGIDFEAIRRETGTPSAGVEKWKRLSQRV